VLRAPRADRPSAEARAVEALRASPDPPSSCFLLVQIRIARRSCGAAACPGGGPAPPVPRTPGGV